jgi:hypothetical protein
MRLERIVELGGWAMVLGSLSLSGFVDLFGMDLKNMIGRSRFSLDVAGKKVRIEMWASNCYRSCMPTT